MAPISRSVESETAFSRVQLSMRETLTTHFADEKRRPKWLIKVMAKAVFLHCSHVLKAMQSASARRDG